MPFDPKASAARMQRLAWQRRLASNAAILVARTRTTWPTAGASLTESPEVRADEVTDDSVDEVSDAPVVGEEDVVEKLAIT